MGPKKPSTNHDPTVRSQRIASRMRPLHWRQLICVFELDGFTFSKRSRGGTSHWIGEKPGVSRPIVIPEYDEVGLDIIKGNMRTAGMSRERFLQLLARC